MHLTRLIDSVIPGMLAVPFVSAASAAGMVPQDVVETAQSAGEFNTLVVALTAAGLLDTLKGTGPFTVFAPNDAAFAKLPAGTVESLLKAKNKKKLTDILTYHIVAGNVKAADVLKMTSAKTFNGASAKITVNGSKVMVDSTSVIKTDIRASTGTIDVIDTVLMPKEHCGQRRGVVAHFDCLQSER